jgi:hypothetical protein
MFFVVEKAKLQRNIAIVRDDRTKKSSGSAGPYMRLEANDDYLKLDGVEASAKFPATVYEPGVLFLKITIFRRLLNTIIDEQFLSVQVSGNELLLDRVRMPMESNDMLLYANPDQAPAQHPSIKLEPPKMESKPEFRQPTLWDDN